MKNTFIPRKILTELDKPARYIGGELNMCIKNPEDVDIRFALCFPDVYEIGMSNTGIMILYEMFNRRSDTYCERVFSPWHDLDAIMREKNIPLFSLESQTPIKSFDFFGISMGYEMCYTNVLQVLDLAGIPLHADERGEDCPVVIGGGTCAYNPEPMAEFFDMFYIGEGETAYDELLDLYKACSSRSEFIRKAAHVEGIYVPSMYEVSYNEDGTIADFRPKYPDIPSRVKRQVVINPDDKPYIEKPMVPFIKVTQDRVTLEIMRGCIRGCRFCQAGIIYRPLREHSLEYLKDYAIKMLESTGHEEISLSSLSSSDYSKLPELLDFLIDYTARKKVNISLPSLRIDAFSLDVMNKIQDVKKSSVTFAPEAGTQRLRDVINKGITEDDIMNGSMEAFKGGWNKVKLYFMLGLPTETYEDRCGIGDLCEKMAENYYTIPKEERIGKVQIGPSTSFFIPKPFTPFQWAQMYSAEEYRAMAKEVLDHIREQINQKSIRYAWHDPEVSVMEGVFARGDRRVSRLIETAYRDGAMYDAWSDSFKPEVWDAAFEKTGLTKEFYNTRKRELTEILPWDFIDVGVTREFLEREWKNAMSESVTPNCREKCSGCGARCYEGGVCFEDKN